MKNHLMYYHVAHEYEKRHKSDLKIQNIRNKFNFSIKLTN